MIIANQLSSLPHQRLSQLPRAACQDQFQPQNLASMQENLEMLKNLREIQRALGKNGSEAATRERTLEQNMKLAAEPPRQFSPETHTQVAAFLAGGPSPTTLEPQDLEKLTVFKKLADQGVQFVEPPLKFYQVDQDGVGFDTASRIKTTPPECAFLKLIAYKFHTPENQLHFCTMNGSMLSTSTLRADYLGGLDFFLEQSQQGQTFYKKTDKGYEAIEWASDFISTYKADPQGALVQARPGDLLQTARALETDGYVPFRELTARPDSQPGVAESQGQVVVGGVLLRKRRPQT
ncbi:MAG: hypothetical protein AMXMBFR33_66250 [Candidatus Xenobia bacterium]